MRHSTAGNKMKRLAVAMLERFPDFVCGYLVNARVSCVCLVGQVYRDIYNCFSDGELITTAEIKEITQYGRRWLIKTKHDECYVIVTFHPHGGRQSLLHLADQFQSASLAKSNWTHH